MSWGKSRKIDNMLNLQMICSYSCTESRRTVSTEPLVSLILPHLMQAVCLRCKQHTTSSKRYTSKRFNWSEHGTSTEPSTISSLLQISTQHASPKDDAKSLPVIITIIPPQPLRIHTIGNTVPVTTMVFQSLPPVTVLHFCICQKLFGYNLRPSSLLQWFSLSWIP